jgi:hypothetical protein
MHIRIAIPDREITFDKPAGHSVFIISSILVYAIQSLMGLRVINFQAGKKAVYDIDIIRSQDLGNGLSVHFVHNLPVIWRCKKFNLMKHNSWLWGTKHRPEY